MRLFQSEPASSFDEAFGRPRPRPGTGTFFGFAVAFLLPFGRPRPRFGAVLPFSGIGSSADLGDGS